tara:strand:+ start:260737 stop:265968 length:5232 start_codon:yes stop_codon:yes gene_type:complete
MNKGQRAASLVIGVGASARGGDAFEELLRLLGRDERLAFVIDSDHDPAAEPSLRKRLAALTKLRVVEVKRQRKIKAGRIYISSPQGSLEIEGGKIRPAGSAADNGSTAPRQHLFRSLAAEQRERAVGIVLSGAGTGTGSGMGAGCGSEAVDGLKAIRESGGRVFVCGAASSEYSPVSPGTVVVDLVEKVWHPREIAAELNRYADHLTGGETTAGSQPKATLMGNRDESPTIAEVKRELETTRSDLERALADMTAANEELKSSNESLLKTNEALRSANNALESSELGIRQSSTALSHANDDLENLLRNTQIATVFLDEQLNIRSFTPAIEQVYELTAADIGRPLEQLASQAKEMPPLPDPKQIRDDETVEDTIVTLGGRFFIRRVLPFHSHAGHHEGVVVTFTDVTRMRLSEERLRGTFDNAAVGISHVSLGGKWLRANDRFCEIVGYRRDQLLQMSIQDITHVDDIQSDLAQKQDLVAGKIEHYSMEKRYIKGTGENIWTRLTVSLSRNALGEPDHFISVIEDISDRKQYEFKLRERAKLATLNSQLATLLAGDDPVETILTACCKLIVDGLSVASCRIWVHDEDEQCLQLSASAGLNDHSNGDVSHAQIGELKIDRIAESQDPILTNDVQHSSIISDPEWAEQEGMVAFAGYPLILAGRTVGVLAMFSRQELSAVAFDELRPMSIAIAQCIVRKRSEAELANAKLRMDLSLEVSNVAVWNWDTQANDVVPSPTLNRIFGFDENAKPKLADFIQRIDPSAQDRVVAAINSSLKSGDDYDEEYPIHWPSGEVRHVRARGQVVLPSAQKTPDFFGVVVDITDRKRRELDVSQREAHLRRVIDNTLGFIGVIDMDGTVREANMPAIAAAGITREEVIGKKFWDTYWWNFDRDVQAELKSLINRAAGGQSIRQDMTYRVAGDIKRPLDFSLSPVMDDDGKVTHLIPSGVDILDRKRAEDAVVQREQRLQLALDSGGMGLWEWDIAADRVVWSDQMYALFGYTRDTFEPTKAGFMSVVHPDDRTKLTDMIASAFAGTCTSHQTEFRIMHGVDGSTLWTDCRGTIHRDANLAPLSIVSVVVDVTQRKRWEAELIDRESHLRRVINNQLGLVGVIDRHGILLEVDDRSLEIARTRREDVIGKHFAEAPWWNYDPVVADQVRDAMRRAYAGEIVRYDVSLFAHGEQGVMIDFMIAPVHGDDGNVEYLIPSGVDIRDRKNIERAIKDTSRRMEMALRAGGLAAWEWTPNQSIWTSEVFDLLGIDRDQKPSSELFFSSVHPDDFQELRRAWQDAIDGVKDYDCEFRIVRGDGEIRWIHGLGDVVRDPEGNVICMHGVNWDSTQDHMQAEALRESERRAHAANASKSEFLANMSHEIRTPMTAILGYADLLRDLIDQDEAIEHLQTIRRNGDYLLEIINDILDLSKIEAGKLDVQFERFEPRRMIEDVRSIMEVRAHEGGLTLDVQYDGMLPRLIESDAKRLKQILINLIGNAIKFTRQGRVGIRVRFDATNQQLQFDITDTGIGISPEQMERLFQPFSQGDASVTRSFGGTGLGLVISRRLAETLGGSITVSSTEGVGSTFTVSIDAGKMAESTLIDYERVGAVDDEHQITGDSDPIQLSCHVLIVDDRRDIRFLSKAILKKSGATVDECEDGLLAVAHIEACLKNGNSPSVVLLDMQMPNLDGYQTAKKLRELGYDRPIIALTADAMQGDMNKCITAGCNDYLSKPIDRASLLEKVEYYVRETQLSRNDRCE